LRGRKRAAAVANLELAHARGSACAAGRKDLPDQRLSPAAGRARPEGSVRETAGAAIRPASLIAQLPAHIARGPRRARPGRSLRRAGGARGDLRRPRAWQRNSSGALEGSRFPLSCAGVEPHRGEAYSAPRCDPRATLKPGKEKGRTLRSARGVSGGSTVRYSRGVGTDGAACTFRTAKSPFGPWQVAQDSPRSLVLARACAAAAFERWHDRQAAASGPLGFR